MLRYGVRIPMTRHSDLRYDRKLMLLMSGDTPAIQDPASRFGCDTGETKVNRETTDDI